MFIAILLSFFITYFANFIEELSNSIQAEAYSEPYQDLRCSFYQKWLTVPEACSEWSQTSKMKIFEKNIFSCPQFQPFSVYTKSSILDLPLCSEYASGTINYFHNRLLMFDWVLDTPLACLKKDRNCEKPVKKLFFEMIFFMQVL